jgi:hypothetical protein
MAKAVLEQMAQAETGPTQAGHKGVRQTGHADIDLSLVGGRQPMKGG